MVGREHEIERLQASLNSNKSELIAVYGRRRIGKTYLVRNIYAKHIKFEFTGLYGGSKDQQLEVFHDELKRVSRKHATTAVPDNWHDAFELLKRYLNSLRGKRKKVLFIDEFPWIDTHKSDFLMYFGHFWNTYCEKRNDLVIVVCGSAASYMVQNIISDRGSLHARITYALEIRPFNLYETKQYLERNNIRWDFIHILHLYIAIGGVPHYLSKVKKGESVVQNIQRLCFSPQGDLVNEFEAVFKSLFSNSALHTAIVRALGKSRKGITKPQLAIDAKVPYNGDFTNALDELEASGFVTSYPAMGKKKKMTLIRLSDEYSRFYLKYMHGSKNQGKDYWKTLSQRQSYITWAGFNFETICLKHIAQIKKALKIEGIHSTNSSWYSDGAQIDLLIERADQWINVCEMKFYDKPYKIGKPQLTGLSNKLNRFKESTRSKHNIALTMLTTYGVEDNDHFRNVVDHSFTMEILFEQA